MSSWVKDDIQFWGSMGRGWHRASVHEKVAHVEPMDEANRRPWVVYRKKVTDEEIRRAADRDTLVESRGKCLTLKCAKACAEKALGIVRKATT